MERTARLVCGGAAARHPRRGLPQRHHALCRVPEHDRVAAAVPHRLPDRHRSAQRGVLLRAGRPGLGGDDGHVRQPARRAQRPDAGLQLRGGAAGGVDDMDVGGGEVGGEAEHEVGDGGALGAGGEHGAASRDRRQHVHRLQHAHTNVSAVLNCLYVQYSVAFNASKLP